MWVLWAGDRVKGMWIRGWWLWDWGCGPGSLFLWDMGGVHYFCVIWGGYLMRTRPPEKMAGAVLGVALVMSMIFPGAAPGRIAGIFGAALRWLCA